MDITHTQFNAFVDVLDDLESDVGPEYVILALKKISDQQLLFLDFSEFTLLKEPVLKVLDTCVREIESFLFESSRAVDSTDQLKDLIPRYLAKI